MREKGKGEGKRKVEIGGEKIEKDRRKREGVQHPTARRQGAQAGKQRPSRVAERPEKVHFPFGEQKNADRKQEKKKRQKDDAVSRRGIGQPLVRDRAQRALLAKGEGVGVGIVLGEKKEDVGRVSVFLRLGQNGVDGAKGEPRCGGGVGEGESGEGLRHRDAKGIRFPRRRIGEGGGVALLPQKESVLHPLGNGIGERGAAVKKVGGGRRKDLLALLRARCATNRCGKEEEKKQGKKDTSDAVKAFFVCHNTSYGAARRTVDLSLLLILS